MIGSRGGREEGIASCCIGFTVHTFGGLLSWGNRGIQTEFIASLRLPCIIREWHRSRAFSFNKEATKSTKQEWWLPAPREGTARHWDKQGQTDILDAPSPTLWEASTGSEQRRYWVALASTCQPVRRARFVHRVCHGIVRVPAVKRFKSMGRQLHITLSVYPLSHAHLAFALLDPATPPTCTYSVPRYKTGLEWSKRQQEPCACAILTYLIYHFTSAFCTRPP